MTDKRYRLIVSDFDGTLCDDQKNVSEENIAAIHDFEKRGGIFAISTGRSPQAIISIMGELGLKCVVSTLNGAIIIDAKSGETVFKRTFTKEACVRLARKFEETGRYLQFYDENNFYASDRHKLLKKYETLTKTKAVLPEKKLSDFILENDFGFSKALTCAETADRVSEIAELKKTLGDDYFITSGGKDIIEICVNDCSKATALSFIADYCGVDLKDTISIGDGINDLEPISVAGLGIAVKNAEEALKEKAFVYGYTNEENAVARIIEEYGIR